jgi:hypothetical protein
MHTCLIVLPQLHQHSVQALVQILLGSNVLSSSDKLLAHSSAPHARVRVKDGQQLLQSATCTLSNTQARCELGPPSQHCRPASPIYSEYELVLVV